MGEITLSALNLNKICRVCLLEYESMFSVFSELMEDHYGKMPKIHEILSSISSIKVQLEDAFPKLICNKCIDQASNCYKFQQLCNRSQELLDTYWDQLKSCHNSIFDGIVVKIENNNEAQVKNIEPQTKGLSDGETGLLSFKEVEIESQTEGPNINENGALTSAENVISPEELEMFNFIKAEENAKEQPQKQIENAADLQTSEKTGKFVDDGTDLQNDLLSESEIDLLPVTDDILPSELEFLNDLDSVKDMTDNEDCDALKNCIPLGEDTVDQLIKDNLPENLDFITPKLKSFDWSLKTPQELHKDEIKVSKGIRHPQTPVKNQNKVPKVSSPCPRRNHNFKMGVKREPPDMNYFKRDREGGISEYDCNVCTKTFKFAHNLRTHLKNHDQEKPYVCRELGCRKAFKAYGALLLHSRMHSGDQPFECKECGKRYKQAGTLTAHMRVHTGSKPFICSVCEKGFRQAPDLTYHMRTHTKEKPYMCTVCGKTMSMQCHLVQHMRSHTGEKPFKCTECDKAFPSSTRLKRHQITHTTLKPFKCTICDKSFNRSSALQVHLKIHNGLKSHLCSMCSKGFLYAHNLKSHMSVHSKKKESVAKKKNERLAKKDEPVATVVDNPDNPLEASEDKSLDAQVIETSIILSESLAQKNSSESFTLYTTDGLNAPESFEIFTLTTSDDVDSPQTFMLYSTESSAEQLSEIATNLQLSAVSL